MLVPKDFSTDELYSKTDQYITDPLPPLAVIVLVLTFLDDTNYADFKTNVEKFGCAERKYRANVPRGQQTSPAVAYWTSF